MRIIAGQFKGRVIKFPNSKLVRPTTDKTKESIFNYLVHSINFDGVKVCDIYAGSGSLGLEALSRELGSSFCGKRFPRIQNVTENISSLQADEECKIFRMDAVRFSKITDHDNYDLILADPPFFKDDIHLVVKNIFENKFLTDDGIMLVERSIKPRVKMKMRLDPKLSREWEIA